MKSLIKKIGEKKRKNTIHTKYTFSFFSRLFEQRYNVCSGNGNGKQNWIFENRKSIFRLTERVTKT